jgi:hypothetical protein
VDAPADAAADAEASVEAAAEGAALAAVEAAAEAAADGAVDVVDVPHAVKTRPAIARLANHVAPLPRRAVRTLGLVAPLRVRTWRSPTTTSSCVRST